MTYPTLRPGAAAMLGLAGEGEHPYGCPVQPQQRPGKPGGGREPGANQRYTKNWEKYCNDLRSAKKAEPAPRTKAEPHGASDAPAARVLHRPSGSQTQGGSSGVPANWSFVGEERDCKRGDIGSSDSPKHGGRCLATPLGALLGWYQESKAAAGEGAGVQTEAVGPPAGNASHSPAALLLD